MHSTDIDIKLESVIVLEEAVSFLLTPAAQSVLGSIVSSLSTKVVVTALTVVHYAPKLKRLISTI
eukprot:4144502-Amphidinium_carterae.1